MVKGISRRVVVVDAPEHRFFEQAIFIVRNDAAGEGIIFVPGKVLPCNV